MKNSRVKRLRAAALRTAVACALLLAATAAPYARQRPRHPPPRPRAPNMNPSIRERQIKMMEMERELKRPAPSRREAELALVQISEDYERIQVVNNRMMAAAFNAGGPDYGDVASSTAEIGRRAGRLRSNLHLPPPAESEKRQPPAEPSDAAAMKKLLLTLDASLMSFVKSPVFNTVDVLDAGAAGRARADLESVIELSQFIHKCAERMAKGAGKR